MLYINLIWFGYIARLSQLGVGVGILLVQMISNCLCCAYRKGGGISILCLYTRLYGAHEGTEADADSTSRRRH
jgi:hypothetical protein